jgi:hypothetical protein
VCVVGPSVNKLRARLIFPFKPNFCNLFEFLKFCQQNPLKNQYLPYLSPENWEINSIKFELCRAFQQHQECFQIQIQFSVLILFNSHWENSSIINSFHAIALNRLKGNGWTLTKIPRAQHEVSWFERSQHDKTKQNNLSCFIDRWQFLVFKLFVFWNFLYRETHSQIFPLSIYHLERSQPALQNCLQQKALDGGAQPTMRVLHLKCGIWRINLLWVRDNSWWAGLSRVRSNNIVCTYINDHSIELSVSI